MYKRIEQSTGVSLMNRQKVDTVPLGLHFFFFFFFEVGLRFKNNKK